MYLMDMTAATPGKTPNRENTIYRSPSFTYTIINVTSSSNVHASIYTVYTVLNVHKYSNTKEWGGGGHSSTCSDYRGQLI